MTILYEVHNGIYVNMTNKCPFSCTFCLRQQKGSKGFYGDLWLEREPTVDEIEAEFLKRDMSRYSEIVFCGFGEPTQRLDDMLSVCGVLKRRYDLPIRVNTNGMSDLINGRRTAPEFEGKVDIVSVSLNTPSKERYFELTKSSFGADSFDALLSFAKDVKNYVKEVVLSTVSTTITEEEERQCAEICGRLGVRYRIRQYESY